MITILPSPTKISIQDSQVTQGGQIKTSVIDDLTRELLKRIHNELKISNIHLQTISNENVIEGDILT